MQASDQECLRFPCALQVGGTGANATPTCQPCTPPSQAATVFSPLCDTTLITDPRFLRHAELPDSVVRAQDYGDVQYARVLVNLDRNCDQSFSPHLSCYQDDPLYLPMRLGKYGSYNLSHERNEYNEYGCKGCPANPDKNVKGYANLLEWAGWVNVFQLQNRASAGTNKGSNWWAYTVIAPK